MSDPGSIMWHGRLGNGGWGTEARAQKGGAQSWGKEAEAQAHCVHVLKDPGVGSWSPKRIVDVLFPDTCEYMPGSTPKFVRWLSVMGGMEGECMEKGLMLTPRKRGPSHVYIFVWNHLEEKLLDQAQARALCTPPF